MTETNATPAVPVLSAEQQAQIYFQQQLSTLAHKHVTVSYTLIAVLVVVLGLAGFGGWLALKFADKQIARAEATEQRFEQAQKDFQTQLAANSAQRAADTQQQAAIVKIVDTRDKGADAKIQYVLQPKTPQQALTDLGEAYAGSIDLSNTPVTPDNYLSFPVKTVQQFSATKIDRDRLFADRDDIKKQLFLEQDKTKTLTADLKKSEDTLGTCKQTVADYKKAATVSKFRKFLGGAEKVGLLALGAVAGYKLGHVL